MELGTLLILLLLLACPVGMLFMHRGGHGEHASHGGEDRHMRGAEDETLSSLEELRSRRAELDAEIAKLEQAETETEKRVAAGGS